MRGYYCSMEEQYLVYDIQDIHEMAKVSGKEKDMIEYLQQSPLNRANKRCDKVCREFLKLLKQKY